MRRRTKLEVSVEADFVRDMKIAGWMELKGDRVRRGYSDRFFFGHGPRTVIVEFKRDGFAEKRQGHKLQDHYRREFRARGYECHRPETEQEAIALCRQLCRENEIASSRMYHRKR